MPRIFVANIDNESMRADDRFLTDEFSLLSAFSAGHIAWLAQPGDIVVLPRDLSQPFKDYMARVLGYAPGAVAFVAPEWGDRHFRPLGAQELLRADVVEQLAHHTCNRSDWSLYPYCNERGVQQLARALGIAGYPNVQPFVEQGGAELLNDKRVFRSLAAGRGIPIAEGAVCNTLGELERAVETLIGITGAVIVKQDRHSGGMGNLIISRTPDISGQGALQVYVISEEASLDELSQLVWGRLAYLERASLVVEAYYPVISAVTAEFQINSRRNHVDFLNCGEVRQAPIMNGLIMPMALTPYRSASFIAGATELARLYCDLGYEGLINVDGIVTTDGELVFNEVNGRVGGCSHIHHIMQVIAGPHYGDNMVVASHGRTVSLDLDQVLRILEARGLSFNATSSTGIVLTAEDLAGDGSLEYLSIAPTREAAFHLETEFESVLIAEGYEQKRGGIEHLANIVAHLTGGRTPAAEKQDQQPVTGGKTQSI